MVIVPFEAPTETPPAPEILNTFPNVPDVEFVVLPRAVTDTVEKLVTEGVLAEIVMLCAPTPTLTIPAPEIFRRLENVPDVLPVVFPNAVMETDDVCTEADTVIVEFA